MKLEEAMIRYRAINNISQTELANRCHLTPQTINSLESGQQTPTRLTREKILLVIGREEVDE